MKQYEVWWAELPEPVGRRPVLLLSRTPAVAYLAKLIVAEVTTTRREIPQEILLGVREGLARPCVANLDNLHVVPKATLAERAGRLAPSREVEVKRALGAALAWSELTTL
ncbi:MAG: type II toxin-antitoxin system PemK/MazF family toxin [Deltaproteobacteria bacterium]|nr:type II toxin-antitoxin system PemK/MazF family toxin [Deltaproteobacteria bacterium]